MWIAHRRSGGGASVERRRDATRVLAESLISARIRVPACDRSLDGGEQRQPPAGRPQQGESPSQPTTRAVAIIDTTIDAGAVPTGVISRGASVTAVAAGFHTVTGGIGIGIGHDVGPLAGAVEDTRRESPMSP